MLQYTGERAVPDMMRPDDVVLHEHLARYRWAATTLRQQIGDGPWKIVDAPCGSGYGTRILADAFPQAIVVGVDIEPDAVHYAAKRYGGERVRFLVYNLDNGVLPAQDVDAVVCFEGIEHVQTHEAVAGYLTAILRPGGWITVSTPKRGGSGGGSPFHTREFLLDEFRGLFLPHLQELVVHGQNVLVGDSDAEESRYFILEGTR
jgi:2-polyprenyl-3-methyl-5-hydroxy-6-metoxy-1,4-benzoquinol methylase